MVNQRNKLFVVVGGAAGAVMLVMALLGAWVVGAGFMARPQIAAAQADTTPTPAQVIAPPPATPITTDNGLGVNDRPHITVSGVGSVAGVPDILHLQIGVASQQTTLADAQSDASVKASAIISALLASGVAQKDIATSSYNIDPVQNNPDNNQTPTIVGFRVTEIYNVTLRDITGAGAIIDKVVASGANTIYGLSFDFSDPTAVNNQAREAAVQDAKAKAQQLATLSGVTLGAPIVIEEDTNTAVSTRDAAVPAMSASTAIVAGTQQVQVQVTIEFAIQ